MDLQLQGKRALVTGGSKGIGKAVARQLALEGCDVAIAARTAGELEAAANELAKETGRKIAPVTIDTSDDASVKAGVSKAAAALGGLDILVNSAAKPAGGPAPKLAEVTDDIFYDDVDVKVMGYLRMAREAAPLMVKSGWGRIINVSGLNARKSGSYVGAIRNVAVAALTKNLADELGPLGINATVIHPGLTITERSPAMFAGLGAKAGKSAEEMQAQLARGTSIHKLIDAKEIAYLVAFLASPLSVSINGDAIACGGGDKGAIYY